MCADCDRVAGVHTRQLLDREDIADGVETESAVLFRYVHTEQTHVRHPADVFPWEAALLVRRACERRYFSFGELADASAKLLVLVCEIQAHSAPFVNGTDLIIYL